jgi:hypothetical protein
VHEADHAIAVAKAQWPTLTPWGVDMPYDDNIKPDEVTICLAFLRQCQPTKTPKTSSYRLKHAAERWGNRYVTNGAMIAAASYLNIKMARVADGPNVRIAVDVSSAHS